MDSPDDMTLTSSRHTIPSMGDSTEKTPAATTSAHHALAPNDPENPQNWPIRRKVYACAAATAFAYSVGFGLTCYTAGITEVMTRFDVSMTKAILGFSLYLFGIAFAPIYTPHLSESFGRVPVYFGTFFIFMLFTLGVSLSHSFASLAVCRFFAGVFGGASLVLIEGTFADVWHSRSTVTYYASLSLASYVGTGAGPLVGGFVFAAGGWRWTQYVTLMISAGAYLFGIGVPETYPRQIARARAKRTGIPHNLRPALSGVTVSEMAYLTIVQPMKMHLEPIVILLSIYLAFTWGVLFQFFILVPVALKGNYKFTIQQVGLAFIAAIVGSLFAKVTATILDRIAYPRAARKANGSSIPIEYRMLPALFGSLAIPTSLFWIAWTAKPTTSFASPILGTFLYVWGSMSVLVSVISYLFDAYPPAAILSALTLAAWFRIIWAGVFPLFIVQMVMKLTPPWALSTFGFIAFGLAPIPWAIWWFGARLRRASKYNAGMAKTPMDSPPTAMTGAGMA